MKIFSAFDKEDIYLGPVEARNEDEADLLAQHDWPEDYAYVILGEGDS